MRNEDIQQNEIYFISKDKKKSDRRMQSTEYLLRLTQMATTRECNYTVHYEGKER